MSMLAADPAFLPMPWWKRNFGEEIMSSFSNPHYMYLFQMKNGKQKLAYGQSPEDALDILRIRLDEAEMALIIPDKYQKISQRRMQEYVDNLG